MVKILELVCIEKYVPISADRQWLGRPIKEREAIARSFVAKAVMKYQHTRSLRHELQSTPNLRAICGFARRQDVPSESTFSRVKVFSLKNWDELFKWFDVLETGMGVTTENGL